MMADVALLATVTRSNLSPDPGVLDLNDETSYVLGRRVEVGSVTWEKSTVTSPFVHGRFVVNERMGAAEAGIEVYVLGSDHTQVMNRVGTLLEAFTEQHEYVLRLVVDSVVHEWLCERADFEVGYMTETIAARHVPVRLSFYRRPVPVSGVL